MAIRSGPGLPVSLSLKDDSNDATVTIGFDRDDNPYNGVATSLATATSAIADDVTLNLPTSGISGAYRVYAKIVNGTNTRYYYATGRAIIAAAGFSKTWIGPASGNWSAAASWTPAGVPAAADSVAIHDSAVSITANTEIAGLDLSGSATLDLFDNDLIIDYAGASPFAVVRSNLFAGAIQSSTAAVSAGLRTLGYAEASDVLSLGGSDTALFSGFTVDATSILIKFTYTGDADLSGFIDGDDYFRIDSHINSGLGNYADGDFNHDGVIDGDDYFWIDSNYPAQGPPL